MDFFISAIFLGIAYSCLGYGIYLSLRIFNLPDITTDGSFALGGACTAVCMVSGIHPLITILIVMTAGAFAGILTGIIHTKLKVHALLAGILVMTALYSVNLFIMGRPNLPVNNSINYNSEIISGNTLTPAGISLIVLVILMLILKSDFGIAMRATGNSEMMVNSMGVNTNLMKIKGLAIANSCTALSGYLIVHYQGFADINMGTGIVISGLAAVIIGEAFLSFYKSTGAAMQLTSVLAGGIIFRLMLALALTAGMDPNYLKAVTSLFVLAIISIRLLNKPAVDTR